jgi:AP2 domain/HNH endonuclease
MAALELASANKIPISFLIDEEDHGLVSKRHWYVYTLDRSGGRYVMADAYGHRIYLHRLITAAPRGQDVDHINGDGLDNRRVNLRVVPHALNLANQRRQQGRSSRYKGVSYYRSRGRWEAYIKVNGVQRKLGYFNSEREAAFAYDCAALAAWGEHALLNLI